MRFIHTSPQKLIILLAVQYVLIISNFVLLIKRGIFLKLCYHLRMEMVDLGTKFIYSFVIFWFTCQH